MTTDAGHEAIAGAVARPTREKKARIFQRDPLDWYVEPEDCTGALLSVERFTPAVLDPCCGGGHIVTTLRAAGYDAYGTDLVQRGRAMGQPWFIGQHTDFLRFPAKAASLLATVQAGAFSIVANPPYYGGKGIPEFVASAFALDQCVKVAVFADRLILGGEGRAFGFFRKFPPHRIWQVVPRPSCPPGTFLEEGGQAKGGNPEFIWLVWDRLSPAPAMPGFGWAKRQMPGGAPSLLDGLDE